MNRKEMEKVIADGGSVLHDGKLHTSVETLPSKAQLAQSSEEQETAAADLDAQIAALQKQREDLAKKKAKSNEAEGEPESGDDEFKKLMELTRDELVKQAEPIAKEKGVELDPKATKAVLARLILGIEEDTE